MEYLLDGSKNKYSITFPAGGLPANANFFWSFTMYDLPNRFLVENTPSKGIVLVAKPLRSLKKGIKMDH